MLKKCRSSDKRKIKSNTDKYGQEQFYIFMIPITDITRQNFQESSWDSPKHQKGSTSLHPNHFSMNIDKRHVLNI